MRAAVFPWREGNRFELLVDGPEFFPRMLVAIARAQQQVELELYLVEAGSCAQAMVQALVQAAERGVRVVDGFVVDADRVHGKARLRLLRAE